MYAKDFEYDGHKLSDFGFIVCSFNGAGDVETVSAGSEITFNKVSHHQGKKQSLTSTKYERCIQSVFQICKNPCAGSKSIITDEEYRNIMRWLNRREFLPFKPIFSDEQKEDVYYNASFNVNKIMANGKLYGLELNMETDKPFGYGSLITEDWTVSTENTGTEINIIDESDEIGCTFPKVIVTCSEDGDLHIKNITEGCETVVKNCKADETVAIDGTSQTIMSSMLEEHDIAADFNYEFFRIGNSYSNRENKITVSLPCDISIMYYPIIKDTP